MLASPDHLNRRLSQTRSFEQRQRILRQLWLLDRDADQEGTRRHPNPAEGCVSRVEFRTR